MSDEDEKERRARERERAPRPHEGLFWRRLAHWGASRGPEWWVRYSPPVFGWAAAALVPSARRAVKRNLTRIRGAADPARDAREVLATFSNYASSLAEILSADSPKGPRHGTKETRHGDRFRSALDAGKGVILVTAHTGGWEAVGPMLARDYDARIMIAMQPERDARARRLQDRARERAGVAIAHVSADDPLASLPLMRHLRAGGVVALQLDRVAPGMRTRDVTLFDGKGVIPEGPLRLAQLTGAPILPAFAARTAYRRYVIEVFEGRTIARRATEAELDDVAQHLATSMTAFLRAHPTQWFQFS